MIKLNEICLLCIVLSSSYSYSATNSDSSFYPMALGNEWEFSSNIDPHSEIIIDTLRRNETLYFGFSRSLSEPNYFLREENNKVFYLNIKDSTEFLLYDFTINIGDTIELPLRYNCFFGLKIILVGISDTISTPSGTFYNCYHFNHITSCLDAGMHESWFARGIGKVKYVASYFAGIAEFLLSDYSIITNVDEKSDNYIIQSYELFQNYPNPFNPTTKIQFTIPVGTRHAVSVQLRVYDVLGNEIATLVNEEKPAGSYEIEFDGTGLSSGIYFYRLHAGAYVEARKMVLLR